MSAKPKPSGGAKAVFCWVAWIVLTIASFFVASAFWTPWIARRFGSIREGSAAVWWVVAVFGTWMAMLVPLIVVMYSKVDKAYEDARIRKEMARPSPAAKTRFRSIRIAAEDRALPDEVRRIVKKLPKTVRNGRLVAATLRNGRKIPYLFISDASEVLGVYGQTALDFRVGDIAAVEAVDLDRLPAFHEEEWLRLDGGGLEEEGR